MIEKPLTTPLETGRNRFVALRHLNRLMPHHLLYHLKPRPIHQRMDGRRLAQARHASVHVRLEAPTDHVRTQSIILGRPRPTPACPPSLLDAEERRRRSERTAVIVFGLPAAEVLLKDGLHIGPQDHKVSWCFCLLFPFRPHVENRHVAYRRHVTDIGLAELRLPHASPHHEERNHVVS